MNMDQMFYLVIDRSNGDLFVPEIPLSAMDRESIVCDIADGQYNEIQAVIEFNPREGTCREVTEDIILSVIAFWGARSGYEKLSEWQRDLVRDHLGKGGVEP